jgi:hypothetical protein
MRNTIPTFESFCADEDLTVLTREQVTTLQRTVHEYMASAGSVAVSGRYLAISNSNFDYYAGLEYSHRNLVFTGKGFKVWELKENGDDCNAASVAERARSIIAGKPLHGGDDE